MYFKVDSATVAFGGLIANDQVTVEVEKHQIVGLIGPNGAGKSTLFKSISGFNTLNSGNIHFNGRDITRFNPRRVCRAGIGCTFQKAQSFPDMTLEESVLVGAYLRRKRKKTALRHAHEMIRFVGLEGLEKVKIPHLNMFDRKKAELAAVLATDMELLLLDELFAGLLPTEVDSMLKLVRKVHEERKVTLFIVEHVLRVIMSLCDKIYVLEYGKIIASGSAEEISSNEQVIEAYLGVDYDVANN